MPDGTAKKTAAKTAPAKKTAAKKATASSSSSPTKGDKVLVQVNPLQNNGDPEAFGFVVGVDERGTPTMVDVRVMVNDSTDLILRSVPLLTKAQANKKDAPAKRAVRA